MNLPVVVIGAGGHARVIIDALQRDGRTVTGAVDRDKATWHTMIAGVPVLGGDDWIDVEDRLALELVIGIGFLGLHSTRRDVFDKFKALGFRFSPVIDPSATITGAVEIGEGAQVLAGCVVQPSTRIGRNTILNTRALADHDCDIGAHAHIAPGAVLCGNVHVGDETLIGAGATVLQSVSVGRNCVVAAGAAVTQNVPDGSRVAGVPAKPLV